MQATEDQDPSCIQADFLIETKENIELLITRIKTVYADFYQKREDYEQSAYMLDEINGIISWAFYIK